MLFIGEINFKKGLNLSNILRYPTPSWGMCHTWHTFTFSGFLKDFRQLQTRRNSGNTPTPASFHLSTNDWLVWSNDGALDDCQTYQSRWTRSSLAAAVLGRGGGACCPPCSRWASPWTVKHRVISFPSLDTVKRRELVGVDGERRRKDWRLLLTLVSPASVTRQPCPLSSACSSVSSSALLRPSNGDSLQVGMLSSGVGVRTTVSPAGS